MRRLLTNRRVVLGLALVAAIAAVALWPRAVPVEVAPVAAGPMMVTIDEEGETRVRERFVISAPVAGHLARIDLEAGDAVRHGETVLARLTPAAPPLLDARSRSELAAAVDAAQAALGQARAERDRAAAGLERARSTLRRMEALEGSGVVAADEIEEARTTARAAEEAVRAAAFAVSRAEYERQLARARLQQPSGIGRVITITSPIGGVVLKRFRESEGVVPAGEPLLEIGNPGQLEVVSDLLSTDAVRVSPGDPVSIEEWGGNGPLQGRVRRVEPSGFMKVSALGVEEQRVNVVVDFEDVAAASRRLGDGYRVEVRIIVWQEPEVVQLPVGSLFRHGESWAVFVVQDGRSMLRVVDIGRRNGTTAEVLGGLATGERVVLHPPDTLRDGMRVVS